MESKGRIGVILPHISCNTETEFIDVIYETAAEYGYDILIISGVINYMDDMLEGMYCKGQTNIYDLILYGDFDGLIFEANIFCS
ncbi:MAG: AraC family transcriptional regulator, partial [Ruminococcus sp.]|nr:AraC family transcriptional regulator [Ruminococcus sp.]